MSFLEDNGYLVFDGVKSSDYGVWINGRDTYNAPARRYKEYVVPGRNGTLTVDEGAFEEQEVTYPAFIVDNFNANIEAFRNELMSRNGYVRMTDSYHPAEYYMAKYMSGLDADVMPWGRAGRFDLKFKRDPRRFLLSGEEPITYPPGGAPGKNLMKYPYISISRTMNGITFTDNGDGSITVNGTATALATFTLERVYEFGSLPPGTYTLEGCPPGGGIGGTYSLTLEAENDRSITDRGEGSTITYSETITLGPNGIYIAVYSGATVNNLTFYPMLRLASEPGGWEPYYDGSDVIKNPTLFPSKPLIRVTGSGTVGIGDETITIASGYDYVDIDSEIQNCYCGNQNANAAVTFSNRKFPDLQPGLNGVTFGTGIESVQITPRWYRI